METRTDIELIAAFAASGDEPFDRAQGEAAFAELVSRHQQMVFRTCLRMLNDAHEAQDATQATFIVLMKKADRLKREGALGGWLHAVARRVSLEAIQRRAAEAKRREAAKAAAESNDAESTVDTEAILRCVDEEIEGLSAIQRQAVVLRYLQGRSQEQSSILAGCPLGTMKRRASDGIARLRSRLAKRGIAIGLPALSAALASEAQATIPETLLPSTMTAIKAYAAGLPGVALGAKTGAAATGAVSANVAVLAKGALNMMFWSSVKTAVVATTACVVVAGTGVVVAQKAMEPAMKAVNVDVVDGNSESSALEQKLKSIVIPGWSITEEPLAKAVAKLVDAISTNDPQHIRVAIELDPPTPSLRLQMFTLLTMDSRKYTTTAMQILEAMANMSGQKITFEKDRVVLSPLQPDKTTVVIPELSFKDTPVADVVKALQEQTGVPIRLQRTDNLPLITLSAKNIQLDNAVLSIAGKTGLAMGYEKDGLVLK